MIRRLAAAGQGIRNGTSPQDASFAVAGTGQVRGPADGERGRGAGRGRVGGDARADPVVSNTVSQTGSPPGSVRACSRWTPRADCWPRARGFGVLPMSGKGDRMMWHPSKAAFRVAMPRRSGTRPTSAPCPSLAATRRWPARTAPSRSVTSARRPARSRCAWAPPTRQRDGVLRHRRFLHRSLGSVAAGYTNVAVGAGSSRWATAPTRTRTTPRRWGSARAPVASRAPSSGRAPPPPPW